MLDAIWGSAMTPHAILLVVEADVVVCEIVGDDECRASNDTAQVIIRQVIISVDQHTIWDAMFIRAVLPEAVTIIKTGHLILFSSEYISGIKNWGAQMLPFNETP